MPWYVLNYIHQPQPVNLSRQQAATQAIDRCNRWNDTRLELFAPTITRVTVRGGRHIMSDTPLTFHYVFVHGNLDDVKTLCHATNGFSFVINQADPDGRYATVTDDEMHAFRTVALAYNNQLPFLDLADVDLQAGDLVEIVEGDFPGLRGYYMPRPRSTSGDIIIAVTGGLGTVLYNIRARYVRVLEFSPLSRRAYDQIDAYVPRLLRALRRYNDGLPPERPDLTAITVFTRRLDSLDTHTPKLQAKLHALLWASYTILGQPADATRHRQALERLESRVTLPATRALLALLRSVIDRRPDLLPAGRALLAPATPDTSSLSAADRALLTEYHHYLTHYPPLHISAHHF